MFKKIRKKIESRRNSENLFWKCMVFIKDFFWRVGDYFNYKFMYNPPDTSKWNERWNNYEWKKDGDEWTNQADFCNQPYEKWKKSIVDNFILKNINKNSVILEIGPGHGRWTKPIIENGKEVIIVDLNKKCIDYCKKKFSKFKNINYYVNGGKKLSFVKDNSIDLIWSYDSFVHMEKDIIESYFKEFSRILKHGGSAIIHHSGGSSLISYIFKRRSVWSERWGERSNVTKKTIKNLAKKYGLVLRYQIDSWRNKKEYNCKLFGDYITKLIKK